MRASSELFWPVIKFFLVFIRTERIAHASIYGTDILFLMRFSIAYRADFGGHLYSVVRRLQRKNVPADKRFIQYLTVGFLGLPEV